MTVYLKKCESTNQKTIKKKSNQRSISFWLKKLIYVKLFLWLFIKLKDKSQPSRQTQNLFTKNPINFVELKCKIEIFILFAFGCRCYFNLRSTKIIIYKGGVKKFCFTNCSMDRNTLYYTPLKKNLIITHKYMNCLLCYFSIILVTLACKFTKINCA